MHDENQTLHRPAFLEALVMRLVEELMVDNRKKLDQVLLELAAIKQQGVEIMADLARAVTQLNEATNQLGTGIDGISTRLDALTTAIKAMGLSEEQEQQIVTAIDAETTRLDALAKRANSLAADPNNPVPPAPPIP